MLGTGLIMNVYILKI